MAEVYDPYRQPHLAIPFVREYKPFQMPRLGFGYLAGEFPDGITTVEGVPAPATIRVLIRDRAGSARDGAVVAEVKTSPSGTWTVGGLRDDLRYDVICRHDGYNDMILSNVIPALATGLEFVGEFTTLNDQVEILLGVGPYRVDVVGGTPPLGVAFEVQGGFVVAVGDSATGGEFIYTLRVIDSNGLSGAFESTTNVAYDPHWGQVVALLNFQGDDGGQVFTDSSGAREWSAHGDVRIDESRGHPEGRFPGGMNDFLSTPASASLILTEDFTIELVICPLVMKTSGILANDYPGFNSTDALAVVLNHNDSPGAISVWHRRSSAAQILYGLPLSLGEDYHIEINRSGGILRFFQNGVLVRTAESLEPFSLGSAQTLVGRYWNGSFDGRIRAIRITNGVCRNTTDFDPPPTPFLNRGT